MTGNVGGRIRELAKRLVMLNDSPRGIAVGFAVGLFLSVIPTFGLGMVAALALAPLLGANLVSTYLGTLIVNPFTAIFFYGLDYAVGAAILGDGRQVQLPRTLSDCLATAREIVLPLYVGGVVVAAVVSVASFAIILRAATSYRRRRGGAGKGEGKGRRDAGRAEGE